MKKIFFIFIATIIFITLFINYCTQKNLAENYKYKYLSKTDEFNKLVVKTSNDFLMDIDSLLILKIAKSADVTSQLIVPKSEIGYQYGLQYGYELPIVLNFLYASLPDSLTEKRIILSILNDKKYKNSTNQKETFLRMIQDYNLYKRHF